MKQGKSLQELAAELERQTTSKRDFIAPTGALRIKPESADADAKMVLEVGGQGEYGITDICHDQIGARLEIPGRYYDKMRNGAQSLLADNVNYWMKTQTEKRMIRTLDGNARAFLSDRYRPLDNFDLAEVVLPRLSDLDCRIVSCELTEARLYIKAVCPKIEGQVEVGDIVQAGVVISNSEVGCGSLSVEPLAFRLVCNNGMISLSKMRQFHVGKKHEGVFDLAEEFMRSETRKQDDKAFWMKVQDLVGATLSADGFGKIIESYRTAKEMKLEGDIVKTVEVFSKRHSLTDHEGAGVLRHLIDGGDLSLYGLMNAVTRFSQDVKDYDRATEFERLGGEVIEMPRQEWKELALAK